MRPRTKEVCKSILIVLLLLSVVMLSLTAIQYSGADGLSGMMQTLSGKLSTPPKKAEDPTYTDAALPVVISAVGPAGRISYMGSQEALDNAFAALGGQLAAALDTAGTAEELTRMAFLSRATQAELYFYYPGAIPLNVLAQWLDATGSECTGSGRLFCLRRSGDTVELLVEANGTYQAMKTEVDSTTFGEVLETLGTDGSFLAAEGGGPYGHLDPMTVIQPSYTAVPAVQASNPVDESFLRTAATTAATTLGFNPYGDSVYRDDSSTTYTDSNASLRIGADGVLKLENTSLSQRFAAAGDSDAQRIELVRSLVDTLSAGRLGDSCLWFSGLETDGQTSTVEFSCYVEGLEVLRADGPAVEARFQGDILTELTLRLRTYTVAGDSTALLPPLQAAAIAPAGTRLRPGYADMGENTLQADWLRS